jgi:hypothetical protein
MVRFGRSSRTYILGGPAELLPEEGLSRDQRRQLAALEARRRPLLSCPAAEAAHACA